MSSLKRIIWSKREFFLLFFILHIALFNVNIAEWGDSYRILRAAKHIQQKTYPHDEKRLPLFSAILSLNPSGVDEIAFGRITVAVFSLMAFVVFTLLVDQFIGSFRYQNLALILYLLNPVYLYWSIRIMADIPFSFFFLLVFYLLKKWGAELSWRNSIVLGVLVGLSALLRFEGFVLFGSIGLAILIASFKGHTPNVLTRFKTVLGYFVGFVSSTIFWFLYRNPLGSSYFNEPSGRVYDLKTFSIYIVSLLFVFGFIAAFAFLVYSKELVGLFLRDNVGILIFVLMELVVTLFWPAAIPRLFIAIIPLIIVVFVLAIEKYFKLNTNQTPVGVFLPLLLLGVYVIGQYFLRLQFLVPSKKVFLLIVITQMFNIFFIWRKQYGGFIVSLVASLVIWSGFSINLHKNSFAAVKGAAEYISENLSGKVAYNDVSSVSDWYLNQDGDTRVSGFYYNFESDSFLKYNSLVEKDIDYLLITNEHNTTMDIDLSKRSYLILIKEFRYTIGGEEFVSQVVKLEKKKLK